MRCDNLLASHRDLSGWIKDNGGQINTRVVSGVSKAVLTTSACRIWLGFDTKQHCFINAGHLMQASVGCL